MTHGVAGRTFGRRPEQRRALLRGLATQLIDHERITTTLEKAKELRRVVEPLITLGKRGDLHARRQAAAYLYQRNTVSKVFGELSQRFRERAGGYTRIYRIAPRLGDGAKRAIIELLPGLASSAKIEKAVVRKKVSSGKRVAGKARKKEAVQNKEPRKKKEEDMGKAGAVKPARKASKKV